MMSIAPGGDMVPHPPTEDRRQSNSSAASGKGLAEREPAPPGVVGGDFALRDNQARNAVLREAQRLGHGGAAGGVLSDMSVTPGARRVRAQIDSIKTGRSKRALFGGGGGGGGGGEGSEDDSGAGTMDTLSDDELFTESSDSSDGARTPVPWAAREVPSVAGPEGTPASARKLAPLRSSVFLRSEEVKERRRQAVRSPDACDTGLVAEGRETSHLRMLYLVSLYTGSRQMKNWIRALPLHVLVFECIKCGVFPRWRHAPTLVCMEWRQVQFNFSEDAAMSLKTLRTRGLLRAMQMHTAALNSAASHTIMYQITEAGMRLLKQKLTEVDIEAVDEAVCDQDDGLLLHAQTFGGDRFFLCRDPKCKIDDGTAIPSTVTDITNVSYVTTPYIPTVLRCDMQQPLSDNRDRIVELSGEISTMDHAATEYVKIGGNVRALMGEWIPGLDTNHIGVISDTLCDMDLFSTTDADTATDETSWTGHIKNLTASRLIDCDTASYVNFEAETLDTTLVDGTQQVQHFGVHLRHDGFASYGVRLDAVVDLVEHGIPLGLMSRVLVDAMCSSSSMLENVLTEHQRYMRTTTWHGTSPLRKHVVLTCDKISMGSAHNVHDLLSVPARVCELKTLLGEISMACDVTEDESLIIGRDGMLLVGPEVSRHEDVLVAYLSLMARAELLQSLHRRTSLLNDELLRARRSLQNREMDPRAVGTARTLTAKCSSILSNISTVIETLHHSSTDASSFSSVGGVGSAKLGELLRIAHLQQQTSRCRQDTGVSLRCAGKELDLLISMLKEIDTSMATRESPQAQQAAAHLASMAAATERISATMQLMQFVLAALVGFQLLDRFGGWGGGMEAAAGSLSSDQWASNTFEEWSRQPGVWVGLSVGSWAGVSLVIALILLRIGKLRGSPLMLRMTLHRPMNLVKWDEFITKQPVYSEHADCSSDESIRVKTYRWRETNKDLWFGQKPDVTVEVDETNGFLHHATLRIDKSGVAKKDRIDTEALRDLFISGLQDAQVIGKLRVTAANEKGKVQPDVKNSALAQNDRKTLDSGETGPLTRESFADESGKRDSKIAFADESDAIGSKIPASHRKGTPSAD